MFFFFLEYLFPINFSEASLLHEISKHFYSKIIFLLPFLLRLFAIFVSHFAIQVPFLSLYMASCGCFKGIADSCGSTGSLPLLESPLSWDCCLTWCGAAFTCLAPEKCQNLPSFLPALSSAPQVHLWCPLSRTPFLSSKCSPQPSRRSAYIAALFQQIHALLQSIDSPQVTGCSSSRGLFWKAVWLSALFCGPGASPVLSGWSPRERHPTGSAAASPTAASPLELIWAASYLVLHFWISVGC